MEFTTPDFVEIKMDAEIGSYQEADDPDRDPRPIVHDTAVPEQASKG